MRLKSKLFQVILKLNYDLIIEIEKTLVAIVKREIGDLTHTTI